MDCSIKPLKYVPYYLVQTTDYFYPIVDDPYSMGEIACANTLSDLYAVGIVDIDSIMMILGVSEEMSAEQRNAVIPLMIKGFKDAAHKANCRVTGGDTNMNPWMTIGGVASAVCLTSEFIMPNNAQVGDVLVLTKPLGTQIVAHAYQWLDRPERWNVISQLVSKQDVVKAYKRAIDSMCRLNLVAARLMHKYNAHAATDVTGFGILGHAQNLAAHQLNAVSFTIHNLPVIANMANIAKLFPHIFKLKDGQSPETSGGLLVCMPRSEAVDYCQEIMSIEGYQAWIVGVVEGGDRSARITDKYRIIEAPLKDNPNSLW